MHKNMYSPLLASLLFLALLIASGCSDRKNISPFPTVSDDARAALDSRVNCNTARSDLAVLQEERASVGKQVLSGVRSVMPIAAVAGILMGDYRDRVEVATGSYNNDIDAKIAQIKRVCAVRD